jgi:hypothetical protein
VTMHRFRVWVAVTAMLQALVFAPLFHVHDQDDHGHSGSFVHAHFPVSVHATSHSEHEVEPADSHEHVRWVDVFTLTAPVSAGFQAVVEFSEPLSVPSPEENRAVTSLQTVRSHSPPVLSGLTLRSPPVL